MKRALLMLVILIPAAGTKADTDFRSIPCEKVSIRVSACEFVTIDNADQMRKYAGLVDKLETMHGLRLSASTLKTEPEGCSPTAGAPVKLPNPPKSYFYETNDASICGRFLGKAASFWLKPRGCDTLPRQERCLVDEPILLDGPHKVQEK